MKSIHIILGVTGSIAAYKAAELVRMMIVRGWGVSVVMTEAATRFVSELTFRTLSRQPVIVHMFADPGEWCPTHISLAEKGNAMVIAPCTANVMAKLAHGIADDIVTCTALAMESPLVVAPAMNERMWNSQATRANAAVLVNRGVGIVEVGAGDLACGCQGSGRMGSLDAIMSAVAGSIPGGANNE